MDIPANTGVYFPAAALISFVLVLVWLFDASFYILIASFVAFSIGFVFCHNLLQNADYCFWLQHVFTRILSPGEESLNSAVRIDDNNNKEDEADLTEEKTQTDEQIKLDKTLNTELEAFFETLVDAYVNSWYTDKISDDGSFTLEIRQLICHSSAKILKSIQEANFVEICMGEIIPVVVAHVERVIHLLQASFPNRSFENQPLSLVELKILERWSSDPHWATLSQENQINYLRAIADPLICKFVDDIRIGGCFVDEEHQKMLSREHAIPISTKWSCHSSRHLLRELLLSTVLNPIIDFCTDPDSLNQLALSLINKQPPPPPFYESLCLIEEPLKMSSESPARKNRSKHGLFNKFSEQTYTQSPDSLLCVKLSDLIRDSYLVKLFEIYIRDLNGPVNYLDCLLQTRVIHSQIQEANNNENSTTSVAVFAHSASIDAIISAARNLFSNFIHSGSPNRIPFNKELVQNFVHFFQEQRGDDEKEEVNSIRLLEHLIEAVYQETYHYLQYNFAIPFYQSENYLGFLCGAPPDVDDLIRGEETMMQQTFPKVLEGSFSLSQFRKKLFNFITPLRDSTAPNASAFFPSHSTSDLEGVEREEGILYNNFEDNNENGTIVLSDMRRDLNRWTVVIDGIEQRGGDGITNPYFVFNLVVERKDLPEQMLSSNLVFEVSTTNEQQQQQEEEDEFIEKMPKHWCVGHRYAEFYALEDKIRDYYGNAIRISALPDRKTTLQLLRIGRNNRTLMESHRVNFERFLQQLLQQPLLKRSDLVYLFLTSEEDSSGFFSPMAEAADGMNNNGSSSLLSDLNPIRAMRKAAKERGQNLKPFILNLLANVLAPPTNTATTTRNFGGGGGCSSSSSAALPSSFRQHFSNSPSIESRDSRRFALDVEECTDGVLLCGEKRLSVVQNLKRLPFSAKDSTLGEEQQQKEGGGGVKFYFWSNLYELSLFFLTTLGFVHLPNWVEALLCSLRSFVGAFVSLLFKRKIEQTLEEDVLNVDMAIRLVKSLHELVVSWDTAPNHSSPSPYMSATPSQISVASSAAALSLLKMSSSCNINSNNRKAQEEMMTTMRIVQQQKTMASDQERRLRAELLLHCLEKRVEECFPYSQMINWLAMKMNNNNNEKRNVLQKRDNNNSQNKKEQQSAPSTLLEEKDEATTTIPAPLSTETAIRQLFFCFQMPALNHQLAFVILDIFVQRILLKNQIFVQNT